MTAHICNTGLCTGSEQNAIAEVTLHHNTHQQYAQKLRSNAILLLKAECSHSGCEPKLNADTQWASGSLQNALYSVQCVLHFANNFTICKVCISHRARNLFAGIYCTCQISFIRAKIYIWIIKSNPLSPFYTNTKGCISWSTIFLKTFFICYLLLLLHIVHDIMLYDQLIQKKNIKSLYILVETVFNKFTNALQSSKVGEVGLKEILQDQSISFSSRNLMKQNIQAF